MATAGNFFPSKNSRKAPPPVDIYDTSSLILYLLTAAKVSPPPAIEDETDVDEGLDIRKISPTDFFVKAQTPIEDFNEHFGVSFSNEEFDTIGGLVVNAFGHVPTRSETTYLQRFEFKVVNADQRRLLSLRVTPPNDPAG